MAQTTSKPSFGPVFVVAVLLTWGDSRSGAGCTCLPSLSVLEVVLVAFDTSVVTRFEWRVSGGGNGGDDSCGKLVIVVGDDIVV